MALVQHLAVSDEPDGSAAADQRGAPVPGGLPKAESGSGRASGAAQRAARYGSIRAARGGDGLIPGITLPLASCRADAVAPHPGGAHPDKVRSHTLDPRLEPSIDERRALSLGIQMMRRPP